MTQSFVVVFLLAQTAFLGFAQEDLGGPLAAEGQALLQHKAAIESASHTEDVSVEHEDSKVLEGMDVPEEPSTHLEASEDVVHDLDDHQLVWAHEPSPDDGLPEHVKESNRLALAELENSNPGPLPNQSSLIDSDASLAFGDETDNIVTAPEDQGVDPDPVIDGTFTEDDREAKKEDLVQEMSFGAEPEGFADLNNANGTVSALEVDYGIKPEEGEAIPKFAQSFPGCGCNYQEYNKQWGCSGTIAAPKSVTGKECCCCGMSCDRRSRCDHDTCDAIGIDQRAEVDAYEKARKAKLGDADALYCDTKLYRVAVGPGRCSNSKNLAACRKIGKWPLCDHYAYAGKGKQCYFPMNKKPCHGHHMGHVGHERAMHFNTMDFFGMCFVTNNGDHTLIPHGEGHVWNNHGGSYNMVDPGTRNKVLKSIPVAEFDNQRFMGGWHTYCVNEQPQR